jgi:TPR repeat protein
MFLAVFVLGCHRNEKLPPEMLSVLKQAREGNLEAQLNIGNHYYNQLSQGSSKRRFDDALSWFTAASEQGSVEAKFMLGQLYERGYGFAGQLGRSMGSVGNSGHQNSYAAFSSLKYFCS